MNEDEAYGFLMRAMEISNWSPERKVERHVRMAKLVGYTMPEHERAQLLAEFEQEARDASEMLKPKH